MTTTFLIMGIFALISFFFFMVDIEEGGFIMIIFLIATGLFGFVIIPRTSDYKIQIRTITPVEIVSTSTTKYIEFEKYDYLSFTSKKDYDNIDSTTTFYLYSYYDKYGELNSEKVKLNLSSEKDSIYIEKGIIDLE